MVTSTQAGHYSELHAPPTRVPNDGAGVARPDDVADGRAGARGAVLSMALCVMVLIASEFMPVSLLTPIASDLRMTEGLAGQAISISGVFAVLTSLVIAGVTARLDRRTVLLSLTALMIVSGTVVAVAPNFGILMLGRAFLGVAIGGFWSMSTATVMRLVPEDRVPARPGRPERRQRVGRDDRRAARQLCRQPDRLALGLLLRGPAGGRRPGVAAHDDSGDAPGTTVRVDERLYAPTPAFGRLRNGGDPAPLHGAVRVVHLLAPVSRGRDQGRRVNPVTDAVGNRCRRSAWDVS